MATSSESIENVCQVNNHSLEEHPQVETSVAHQIDDQPPQEQQQIQLSKTESDPQKSLHSRGGYECEFVQQPTESFQTDCAICLQVLRKPHLISCCGHNFCQTCIEHIRSDGKSCPLCQTIGFTLMHNKGLERSLKDLEVRCTYTKSGCDWVGKLGQLDLHLNANVDLESEKQLEGCGFVEVECIYSCGNQLQRRLLTNHQREECPKRPYSCDYCREYESIFEDVSNNHWPECKCYPLSCPNKCTPYAIERQNLEQHVSKDCPLTVVTCDFHYAGCEVQLHRKDMPAHLAESFTHVTLLVALNYRLAEKLDRKDEEFRLLSEQSKQQSEALRQEIEQLKVKQESDNAKLQKWAAGLQRVTPLLIYMPEFIQHKADNDSRFSDPFYTHPGGYKMCLRVDANGCREAQNTHVSVFVYLMGGEFDEHLKWPLLVNITVELLNQLESTGHYKKIVSFGERDHEHAIKLLKGETAKGGWGFDKFISHTELFSDGAKYLKDGRLHFQVTKIEPRN